MDYIITDSNSKLNNIALQCCCLANCSYLRLMYDKNKDVYDLSILHNIDNIKRVKEVNKLNSKLIMDKELVEKFISNLEILNTQDKVVLILNKIYIKLEKENNLIQILFYLNKDNFLKNIINFDMVVTLEQINEFCKIYKGIKDDK